MASVMSMYGCDTTCPPTSSSVTSCAAYGAQSRIDETYCDETLAASSMRPPRSPSCDP